MVRSVLILCFAALSGLQASGAHDVSRLELLLSDLDRAHVAAGVLVAQEEAAMRAADQTFAFHEALRAEYEKTLHQQVFELPEALPEGAELWGACPTVAFFREYAAGVSATQVKQLFTLQQGQSVVRQRADLDGRICGYHAMRNGYAGPDSGLQILLFLIHRPFFLSDPSSTASTTNTTGSKIPKAGS